MIVKYKVSSKSYNPRIEKVEIVRETAQCVFLPPFRGTGSERREAKSSDYADYFDSFEDAKSFLVTLWEFKVNSARLKLEQDKGTLGNIKVMKEQA